MAIDVISESNSFVLFYDFSGNSMEFYKLILQGIFQTSFFMISRSFNDKNFTKNSKKK